MVCLYFGMQVETERKPHQCAMQKISGKVILGGHVFLEVRPLRRGGGMNDRDNWFGKNISLLCNLNICDVHYMAHMQYVCILCDSLLNFAVCEGLWNSNVSFIINPYFHTFN